MVSPIFQGQATFHLPYVAFAYVTYFEGEPGTCLGPRPIPYVRGIVGHLVDSCTNICQVMLCVVIRKLWLWLCMGYGYYDSIML